MENNILLEEKDDEEKSNLIAFFISSIGAIIITSAIIHTSYTQILPLTQLTIGLILIVPAAFIGLLNEDLKESMLAMFLAIVGTILLTSFTRILPTLLGVFPSQGDVFAFQQIGETLAFFFLMVPFFIIGTIIGVILNEFVLKY
ncbi:MAG: hypothetical protein ACFFDT_03825 [Candidatus Hodarchaeota archaeon]